MALKNAGIHTNQNPEPSKDFKQHAVFFLLFLIHFSYGLSSLAASSKKGFWSCNRGCKLTAGEPNMEYKPVWFLMYWPSLKSLNLG